LLFGIAHEAEALHVGLRRSAEEGIGAFSDSLRAFGSSVVAVAFLARVLVVVAQADGGQAVTGGRHLLPGADRMPDADVGRGAVTGVDAVDGENRESLEVLWHSGIQDASAVGQMGRHQNREKEGEIHFRNHFWVE